jgi:hypothetical protein
MRRRRALCADLLSFIAWPILMTADSANQIVSDHV